MKKTNIKNKKKVDGEGGGGGGGGGGCTLYMLCKLNAMIFTVLVQFNK